MKTLFYVLAVMTFISCSHKENKTIGSIERIDPALDAIIQNDPKVEVIADGFEWSEGPVWIKEQNMLLFSDVPTNTIYKWTAEKGKEIYLTPSGYTGTETHYSNEPGSNGLTLNSEGKLVLCQHGDRRVALMDAPLTVPEAKFISLADNYQGKKLNSPNDAVFRSNGDLFLTDPPYGLPKQENDSSREIPFQGVYKVSKGVVSLVTDSLTRPNGIAFLPGEKTLIVANSDPGKATWYAFDLLENDSVANARIFYDATQNTKTEKGLPDGMKVDKLGNVFASGPGGIWIFNKEGKLLGKIKISEATSNCALADDDKTLYATCDMYVVRIKLRD
ncbi:MAG: SMP-30/gluconolactonase/LRE family protein [Chryseolinea sp.]